MRPKPPRRSEPRRSHSALSGLAEDGIRTLTGLVLYVGALALIGSLVLAAAPALTEIAINAATDAFAGRTDLASSAGANVVQAADGGRNDVARGAAPGAAAPSLRLRGAM